MKLLIQESDAVTVLNPYMNAINTIMVDSLTELNKALGSINETVNNRAKACLLHSIAIEKAKRVLMSLPGIKIFEKYQSIQIVFDQQLIGRIKKVDSNNLSKNINTRRNQQIIYQQLSLFDMPEMTCIDIAYNIDPTWSIYEKLLVVCRVGKQIYWDLPISAQIEETTTLKTEPVVPQPKEEQIKIKKLGGKD